MVKEISDALLDSMIKYYFDRPVVDEINWIKEWHNAENAAFHPDYFRKVDGTRVDVALRTRIFETCETLPDSYTDLQINAGLWQVMGEGSELGQSLFDDRVPLEEKLAFVESIYSVYTRLFVLRCQPVLEHKRMHRDKPSAPLNSICYMWWDIFPTWGKRKHRDQASLDVAILNLMGRILELDHTACRESALHGLGHWQHNHPAEVKAIIDHFLARNPYLSPDLRGYAESARDGAMQ